MVPVLSYKKEVAMGEIKALEKKVDRLEEVLMELALAQKWAEQDRRELRQSLKELSEAQRKTEEALKRLTRKLEGISERLGTLAEDILAPGVPYLLEKLGFRVKSMWVNEEVKLADGRCGEFDVAVVAEKNGRELLFLCEVKSKLEEKHFEQLKKQCELYREIGMRRDLPIKPVLAALRIPEHLVNYATKRGVLLVKMGGDYLEALNPEVV